METLIQFKTAELAKEKVYNINTYSNCWVKTTDNKIIHNSERDDMNYLHDRVTTHLFQPSQSALQKWLREVHNILVDVVAYYDEEQLPLSKSNLQKPKGYFAWDYYSERFNEEEAVKFDVWEDAFEYGLFEALKLIP